MKISPLRLESYFVQELSFRRNPGVEGVEVSHSTLKTRVSKARRRDNPREWKVRLQVSFGHDDTGAPYVPSTVAEGFFSVSGEVPEERIETLVAVNAPALLFGAIRELIFTVTSRAEAGAVRLPSVTFVDEKPPGMPSLSDPSDESTP
jgi:preprotein translocase subunit SecB